MGIAVVLSREIRWKALLALSFIPLLVKAGVYVTIGSYVPLLVFGFFAALVGWGLRQGPRVAVVVVRAWASAIIFWGLARLTVLALFTVTSASEAHVESQFSAWYLVSSLGHIALGYISSKAQNPRARNRGRRLTTTFQPLSISCRNLLYAS